MPIELYTWAMGWVLAGQLYSGIGAELQLDRQRLELRYIPEAVYPGDPCGLPWPTRLHGWGCTWA